MAAPSDVGSSGDVLSDPNFRDDLLNCLVITLATVLVGFYGALAIARLRFVGCRVFVVVVLIVQIIPSTR